MYGPRGMAGFVWSAVALLLQLKTEKHQNWLVAASQYSDVHTTSMNTSKSGSGRAGYTGQSGTLAVSATTLCAVPSTQTSHSSVAEGLLQSHVTLTTSANDPATKAVGCPLLTGGGVK